MATNSLSAKTQNKTNSITEFMAGGMQVKLTPEMVRAYLVSGDKDKVTMQEVATYINLCKYSGLNPWLKEAYLIKYGNEPATMVTGKEAFKKRAEEHPAYDGDESGIIVIDENSNIIYRKGTMKLPNEEIIGGYAEVWRKDHSHSTRIEVSFDEYAGRKRDGSLNSQWAKRPATMIRKVALVQALREAFPRTFGGMYSAEEQGVDEVDIIIPENTEINTNTEIIQEQTTTENNDAEAALFGEGN